MSSTWAVVCSFSDAFRLFARLLQRGLQAITKTAVYIWDIRSTVSALVLKVNGKECTTETRCLQKINYDINVGLYNYYRYRSL